MRSAACRPQIRNLAFSCARSPTSSAPPWRRANVAATPAVKAEKETKPAATKAVSRKRAADEAAAIGARRRATRSGSRAAEPETDEQRAARLKHGEATRFVGHGARRQAGSHRLTSTPTLAAARAAPRSEGDQALRSATAEVCAARDRGEPKQEARAVADDAAGAETPMARTAPRPTPRPALTTTACPSASRQRLRRIEANNEFPQLGLDSVKIGPSAAAAAAAVARARATRGPARARARGRARRGGARRGGKGRGAAASGMYIEEEHAGGRCTVGGCRAACSCRRPSRRRRPRRPRPRRRRTARPTREAERVALSARAAPPRRRGLPRVLRGALAAESAGARAARAAARGGARRRRRRRRRGGDGAAATRPRSRRGSMAARRRGGRREAAARARVHSVVFHPSATGCSSRRATRRARSRCGTRARARGEGGEHDGVMADGRERDASTAAA